LAGAFELRRAIEAGVITADHVHAEIGELVSGTATGRTDDRSTGRWASPSRMPPQPAWCFGRRKDMASAADWRLKT
jgi:hypothetical protein